MKYSRLGIVMLSTTPFGTNKPKVNVEPNYGDVDFICNPEEPNIPNFSIPQRENNKTYKQRKR